MSSILCWCMLPGPGDYGGLERHALYESAVQSPQGDISYLLRFYNLYVGMQVQLPNPSR